jgi:hypothetical protein
MPIMSNRKRLATLPLHFSGLGQQYEKGLLVENSELPVGQLVPYFEFTHHGKKLNSYDLIDGCYFYLIYSGDALDKSLWLQYNEAVKLIQIKNSNDWQRVCSCLNLQAGEAVFMRPDGIIAAKAEANDAYFTFFPILKSINLLERSSI